MGLHHNTYGDELSYVTMRIASDIMLSAIKEYIEHQNKKIQEYQENDNEENKDTLTNEI